MSSELRIVIITMGLSCIVSPLVKSPDKVVGIVECAPRNVVKIGILRNKWSWIKNVVQWHMDLEGYAKHKKIPYTLLNKTNHKYVASVIRNWNPDLIVVYSMSQLLRENIFSIPRLGTINLHPSLLPLYRGPNPTLWQYADMVLNPGVTVHYIDSGEDTGDILAQATCDISLGEPLEIYNAMLQKKGVELLINVIEQLRKESIHVQQQMRESPVPRARNLQSGEEKDFIHWNQWSVRHVWHVLHGLNHRYEFLQPPWGASMGICWYIGGWEKNKEKNLSGTIYKEKGKIYVACKDGRIRLHMRFSLRKFLRNLF